MNYLIFKTTVLRLAVIAVMMLQGMMNGHMAMAQDGRLGKTQMQKLSHWIGEWEGSGWQMQPSGQRVEFKVKESVKAMVNGLVLLVEGKGMSEDAAELGHDAMGMIYYNLDNKRYEFHSATMQGMTTLATAQIDENGDFIWGFTVPQGELRFTITFTEDTWVEKGAFSPDGGSTWYPSMEMNLKKVK